MKKLALAGAIAFALAGCAIVDKVLDTTAPALCAAERVAHQTYVRFVAPLRPADKVAREAAFYAKVEKACAEGGTLDQIRAAIAAAKAARD